MKKLAAFAISLMASCTPIPSENLPTRAAVLQSSMPAVRMFSGVAVAPPARSNREISQDFLDLSFRMESGRTIPYLTRFDGPIRVRTAGAVSTTLVNDLQVLLGRLRSEAQIDIALDNSPSAQITVEAVPRATLQRAVPRAACFVVPRVSGWAEFSVARRTAQVDWTTLTSRDRATIFVPADVAPQEIRDCLHEELAQALGPLNDLYRLPDSVFNDDNIHAVLTGFDMLVLRAYYAPELRSGMTRTEVAARLPSLLNRLNPRGRATVGRLENDTSRDWIDAMELAIASNATPTRRRDAAARAVRIGRAFGWTGTREGFAQYAYGRLQVGNDPQQALLAFNAAETAYRRSPITAIHNAHIAVQKAAFALAAGDGDAVLRITDGSLGVAQQHQNAALLATLLMFHAEAYDLLGNDEMSQAARLDSLGWARYGFGSDANVQARLNEIAALRPF